MKHTSLHIFTINTIVVALFVVLIVLAIYEIKGEQTFPAYFNGHGYELKTSQQGTPIHFSSFVNAEGTISENLYKHITIEEAQNEAHNSVAAVAMSPSLAPTEETNFFHDLLNNAFHNTTTVEYKAPHIEMEKALALLSNEVVIDSSEDVRTLGYSGQRKLAQDIRNDLYITYRKKYNDYQQIFISHFKELDGKYTIKRLLEPISIESEALTQRVPSIAIDTRNTVHAVWYGALNTTHEEHRQIQYARMIGASNIWSPAKIISPVAGFISDFDYWQEHPDIFAGSLNRLYVVWEGKDQNHKKQQVKFSRSFDGGESWSMWKNINPDSNDSHTQSRPTIIQDESKRLHVFMYSSKNTESDMQQIQYTYSDDLGETWNDWQILSSDVFDARHISATVDERTVHIAYRAKTTEHGPTRIFYTKGSGDTWTQPLVVSSEESTSWHFFPSIGITKDEDVCIAWNQTKHASGYPNEAPNNGDVYLACGDDSSFAQAIPITSNGTSVFPNLPLTIESVTKIPVAYYNSEDEQIILRYVKLTI